MSITSPTSECPYISKIPSDLNQFITAKNSLLVDVIKSKTIDAIIVELKRIPDLNKYKIDLELIKLTCKFIENAFDKKITTEQKKAILLEIFIKLFGNILSEQDKLLLGNAYDFLLNNGKINKIKLSKKYFKYTKNLLVGLFKKKN